MYIENKQYISIRIVTNLSWNQNKAELSRAGTFAQLKVKVKNAGNLNVSNLAWEIEYLARGNFSFETKMAVPSPLPTFPQVGKSVKLFHPLVELKWLQKVAMTKAGKKKNMSSCWNSFQFNSLKIMLFPSQIVLGEEWWHDKWSS